MVIFQGNLVASNVLWMAKVFEDAIQDFNEGYLNKKFVNFSGNDSPIF